MADSDDTLYDDDCMAAAVLLSFRSDSDHTVQDSDDIRAPKSLMEIDNESDSDDDTHQAEDKLEADKDAPQATEKPDTDYYGRCDFCSILLGPFAPVTCRFFRCGDCESCFFCDGCCYEIHLYRTRNTLEEWDVGIGEWVEISLRATRLGDKYNMNCGSCCKIIARAGFDMPIGMLHCSQCDSGLLCRACCMSDHAAKPLHFVKVGLSGTVAIGHREH
ncbi:hypothetical protein C8R44DRAFT_880463 [Mycena epipterygia]|nr:hypothetical protein C8R44DRAFT_880463 [Mycena epipterygia]